MGICVLDIGSHTNSFSRHCKGSGAAEVNSCGTFNLSYVYVVGVESLLQTLPLLLGGVFGTFLLCLAAMCFSASNHSLRDFREDEGAGRLVNGGRPVNGGSARTRSLSGWEQLLGYHSLVGLYLVGGPLWFLVPGDPRAEEGGGNNHLPIEVILTR
jgi:hypothetical protein